MRLYDLADHLENVVIIVFVIGHFTVDLLLYGLVVQLLDALVGCRLLRLQALINLLKHLILNVITQSVLFGGL